MSHSAFNPPPTAATIAPELVPVVVQMDRESATELRITWSFQDGTEASTLVQIGQDGDVYGDAPNDVLCEVERKLARYPERYTGSAL